MTRNRYALLLIAAMPTHIVPFDGIAIRPALLEAPRPAMSTGRRIRSAFQHIDSARPSPHFHGKARTAWRMRKSSM